MQYCSNLANNLNFDTVISLMASLPAVYTNQAGFGNEPKICQTATNTMHVLRNTDCRSTAHRNTNVEQIPIMYNFYNADGDYIGKMLDEFGLINMNGRCYDPVAGRFLSPDIIVQNPNNTQCYNRYSYAINNPLKFTDPSGWSWDPISNMLHSEQVAMGFRMRELQREMQAHWNNSTVNIIGVGPNRLSLMNSFEGIVNFSIQTIANYLSILIIPGLWGNQGTSPRGDDIKHEWNELKSNKDRDGMIKFLISTFGLNINMLGKKVNLINEQNPQLKGDYNIHAGILPVGGLTEPLGTGPDGHNHKITIDSYGLFNESLNINANRIYHELIHVYQLNYTPEMNHYEREVQAYSYSIFPDSRFYIDESINLNLPIFEYIVPQAKEVIKHYDYLNSELKSKYYDFYKKMKYYENF